ncbi:MAG: helix-turn-helix domain-containing protein [Opitutae bacterium]|nr:helix-turn-helix domain-containing protein [Opitutae bacterium]
MNRRFRPLLLDRVKIRIPGLHVLTFAIHRHLPELASVNPHRHAWSQALLYLSGNGVQRLAGREVRVEPGTLVLVPPEMPHSFSRAGRRAPLCLLIDFRAQLPRASTAEVCCMSRSELSAIRQKLAALLRQQEKPDDVLHWESSLLVLQLLLTLLRAAGWIDRMSPGSAPRDETLRQRLESLDVASPLAEFIEKSGYQRDHLNRVIKKATGLTLGQYRAGQRLHYAKRELARGVSVAAVATAVGLPDQSYFARWFRRQTGQKPTAWKNH